MTADTRQIPLMRERLAFGGDLVTLRLIPQHPLITPDPVEVRVKGPIYSGPVGPHLAVFDYDREGDRVHPPAIRSGASFPEYDVADPRFHQLNAYAIGARALDLVESELGRLLGWTFEANRLIVLPHAGYLANAFYEEDTHSLQLYSFRLPDGSIYHTSLVHDIVAHETGHAILDAVRDRYTEGNHRETAAIHEAVGDLSAVFAAFSLETVRQAFLAAAGPTLRGPNLVASIAEDFETSTTGRIALRDLSVPPDRAALAATTDPHVLSLALSSAIWEILVRMYEANRAAGDEPDDAFKLARTALQRMVVRGFDYLPPADATFADFATAMYRADRFANPVDTKGYRAIVAATLAERGVVPTADAFADESDASAAWPALPRTWPRITPAEAYVFLDQNRDRLALSTQPRYRDFVVRDLQLVSKPPQHEEIQAVVLTYEYPVDVELGAAFGDLAGQWLPIWGGGALVFDVDGRLRHHAEKPVTRERIREALRFLGAIADTALVRTGASLGERLLLGGARQPYVATTAGDRVVIRGNPAARCGARAGGGGAAG